MTITLMSAPLGAVELDPLPAPKVPDGALPPVELFDELLHAARSSKGTDTSAGTMYRKRRCRRSIECLIAA
jgi:hypothetical protein